MPNSLNSLLDLLRERKQTVGFAESCTGGKLSALFTEQPGVSEVFLGAVVSYSNQVKEDLLGVKTDTLANFGAVSEETAREMARGARQRLKTDWAVAITGIAGPGGGSEKKPVGTVCFAVTGPEGVEDSETRVFSGERTSIQHQAAGAAMDWLSSFLKK
ncbi:MAG: CinA family protein [Bdellovibrionaceae bacterium]|nr:CinA family protein [Pseudobdellovibrionaceae bacterium]